MLVRIYADGVGGYADILETFPPDMIKVIEKAPPCKRLSDIAPCNSRCPMGAVFELNGTLHKKCRYSSFMFTVNDESHASIRQFIEKELAGRMA
jgi:hypothetical protein